MTDEILNQKNSVPRAEKTDHLYRSSILIFLFSLALPAIVLSNGPAWFGYEVLIYGWSGFFIGQLAWLANLIWCSVYLAIEEKKYTAGMLLAVIGFAVGLHAMTLESFPRNEGGVNPYEVSHLGVGFYVWELSFLVSALYCGLKWRNKI